MTILEILAPFFRMVAEGRLRSEHGICWHDICEQLPEIYDMWYIKPLQRVSSSTHPRRGGDHPVGVEEEVQTGLFEDVLEELDHLESQHVLPHIISHLRNQRENNQRLQPQINR